MIWLAIVLLAAVALAPLGFNLRRASTARGRREAAIALHRAQLVELDRDLADGRIAEAEHTTAKLEVQRRLLAAADAADPPVALSSRGPVLTAMLMVPVAAFALYIVGGSPGMPAAPLAERIAEQQQRTRQEDALIGELRTRLVQLSPQSPQYRQGYVLLGNAEASRGHLAEAARAWGTALNAGFDPTLAVETAEAMTETAGKVTDEAAGLFRRALAESPPDAPWRPMAQKRLAEANK